jgi:ABC-2 type transport system permease protein
MNILSALYCETIKVLRSLVFWLTFVVFAVSFVIIILGIKSRSWADFFDIFLAVAGTVELLVTFFVAARVFGREFMDKMNKDLIAKPMSRTTVVLSKFIIIFLWCFVFMIFLLLFNLAITFLSGFTGFTSVLLFEALPRYIIVSLFYIIICPAGAFVSSISKGILAPIGIIFVINIASNVLVYTSAAVYVPWTIPSTFLQTGSLTVVSIVILIATGLAGIAGTLAWWRFAEQR